MKFKQKWGCHVFNQNHPAYVLDLWSDIVKNIGLIKKGYKGKMNGFELNMVKRQLYHMTFLDQNPNDPFEVIGYNDSERLNEYSGLTALFADFQNSGLAEFANMSFDEFITYPNWFCDWLVNKWSLLVRTKDSHLIDKELNKELEALEKASRNQPKKQDPFNNVNY